MLVSDLPQRPSGFVKPDNGKQIFFYEQDCYVLSNFSSFRLFFKNLDFDTSEHAYHWTRFKEFPEIQAQILKARSAHEAFQIAQRSKFLVDQTWWNHIKILVMVDIVRAKVAQHQYVHDKLLETGIKTLIEDSWRDAFWGWGGDGNGRNVLGQIWMHVREELRTGTTKQFVLAH